MFIHRAHPPGDAAKAKRPHRSTWTFRALLSAAITLGLVALATSAHAAVDVRGIIQADTTWTAADSPYTLTGSVTVAAGVTLTIEPGTTVIGTVSTYTLFVDGTLVADGTAAAPILFRGVNPNPNTWEGIAARTGSHITLRHVEIRDADRALLLTEPGAGTQVLEDLYVHNYLNRGLWATAAAQLAAPPTVRLLRARFTGDGLGIASGLYMSKVALSFTQGEISGHGTGVFQFSAPATLIGVVLANNRRAAVETQTTVNFNFATTCDHCTLVRNGVAGNQQDYGAAFILNRTNAASSGTFAVRDSVFIGNRHLVYGVNLNYTLGEITRNVWSEATAFMNIAAPANFATDNLRAKALLVDEANGDFRLTDRSPARFWSPDDPANVAGALAFDGALTGPGLHGYWYQDLSLDADTVYDLSGDMVVAPGATLTLASGTTLRMAARSDFMAGGLVADRIEIEVRGELVTNGTADHPVVFTSAAAVPAARDWYGIHILASAGDLNTSNWDVGYATYGVHLDRYTGTVANARLHHCTEAGLLIDGGAPTLTAIVVENNRYGIWARNAADVTIQIDEARRGTTASLVARRNSEIGLYIESSSVDLSDGVIHDNGQTGISTVSSIDSRRLNLTHSIVARNGSYGINASRANNAAGLAINLESSAITHNGSGGFYTFSGGNPVSLTCNRTNNWGNGSSWFGVSAPGGTCFGENPLYADEANRDYAPTRWSPHRGLGSSGVPGSPIGGYVGPFPYVGAEGPHLMGYIWEDFTFTRAGSPYTLLGDVTVPAGVTVNVEPGVEFRVPGLADGMGGGKVVHLTEFRCLAGSTCVLGTAPVDQPELGIAGEQIVFRPSDPANANLWAGLRFEDTGTSSIYNVRVESPNNGLHITGPSAPLVKYFTAVGISYNGIYAAEVVAASPLSIHGAHLTGTIYGNNLSFTRTGINLVNANVRLSSSFVTHFDDGIYAYSTSVRPMLLQLVNNSIVRNSDGLKYERANAASPLSIDAYNTLVSRSMKKAIYDLRSGITSTTDRFYNTSLFDTTTTSYSADVSQAGMTVDPLIEDTDWTRVPRWADGQVWAESPTIDAGYREALPFPVPTDILGRPRVVGVAADLGAWEFDPAANREPRADAVTASIMLPRREQVILDGSAALDPDGQIVQAFWTMNDGTVLAGLTVSHTFNTAGAGQLAYLTIVDDQGAEDHALLTVNVNIRPVAEAGPPVFQAAGPAASVSFDGTLSTDPDGTVTAWLWDFGDGTFSALKSPSHVYLSAGLYAVRLTVTDNEGLTHSDTTLATVAGAIDTAGPLIEHTEIEDGQPADQPVTVRATVRDPAGVAGAELRYRVLGGADTLVAPMQSLGGDLYEGVIPAQAVTAAGVAYWIVATDGVVPNANRSESPRGAPDTVVYDFLVRSDMTAPEISHVPVGNGQISGRPVSINANISDATGIAEARMYFRKVGENLFGSVVLNRVAQTNTYTGQIPAFWVTDVGVEYYIEARDTSSLPNTSRLPLAAPANVFAFTVLRADQVPPVITHQPIVDGQIEGQPVRVEASIVDAAGNVTSALVYFRALGQPEFASAVLGKDEGSDTWRGIIPGDDVTVAGVQYYLTATDTAGNLSVAPAGAPAAVLTFAVSVPDLAGPGIVHTPVADDQPQDQDVAIGATVTDPSGVATVILSYRVEGAADFIDVALEAGANDTYAGSIPAAAVQGLALEYHLTATDLAVGANARREPEAGEHRFSLIQPDLTAPAVVITPVEDGQLAGSPVMVSAVITDAVALNPATAGMLVWGPPGGPFNQAPMLAAGGDTYMATIPGADVRAPSVGYYVLATDAAGNQSVAPADAPDAVLTFAVFVPDLAGPGIVHTPVADERPQGQDVAIDATVIDTSGVATVILSYRVEGAADFIDVALEAGANDTYAGSIPAAAVQGLALEYHLTATDLAVGANARREPEAGEHRFSLIQPDLTGPTVVLTPIADGQVEGSPVTVSALITDAEALDPATAGILVWGPPGGPFNQAPMLAAGGDTYLATIPGADVLAPAVAWYVLATDAAGNQSVAPADAPDAVLTFAVFVPDLAGPIIEHTPPDGPIEPGQPFDLSATIIDASGIGEARLHFRNESGDAEPENEQPWLSLDLMAGENDEYTVRIPGQSITGPTLAWYFEARDTTAARLRAYEPADAPATVHRIDVEIEALDLTGPTIEAAVPPTSTTGLPITVSALITDPSGVDEVTLRYRSAVTGDWLSAPMQPDAQADTYVASVPGILAVEPAVEVQIVATDALGNTSLSPAVEEAQSWYVAIEPAAELSAPVIVHSPPASAQRDAPLALSARISDASGIASARVHCRADDEDDFEIIDLRLDNGDRWSVTLPAICLAGAELSYFFEATDASPQANRATEPLDAPEDLFRVVTLGNSPDPDQGVEADMGTPDMMVIIVGDIGVEADEGIEADQGTEADLGIENDMAVVEADQGPENDLGIEADTGIENDMGIGADTGIEADRGTNDGGPIADLGNERDGGLTGPDGGNTSDGGEGGSAPDDGGCACNVSQNQPASPALLLLGLLALIRRRRG